MRSEGVERAIVQLDFEVDERIASQHASHRRFLDSLVDGGNVLTGDHATDDLVDELVASAAWRRLDAHPAVTKLPASTSLLLVLALPLASALEGFAVGDLRTGHLCLNAVLAPQLGH